MYFHQYCVTNFADQESWPFKKETDSTQRSKSQTVYDLSEETKTNEMEYHKIQKCS